MVTHLGPPMMHHATRRGGRGASSRRGWHLALWACAAAGARAALPCYSLVGGKSLVSPAELHGRHRPTLLAFGTLEDAHSCEHECAQAERCQAYTWLRTTEVAPSGGASGECYGIPVNTPLPPLLNIPEATAGVEIPCPPHSPPPPPLTAADVLGPTDDFYVGPTTSGDRSGILAIFVGVLSSLGTTCVLVVGGLWLGRLGAIPAEGAKAMSAIAARLLIPCLLFDSVVRSASIDLIASAWLAALLPFVYVTCGAALGMLCAIVTRPAPDFERGMIAAVAFGNSVRPCTRVPAPQPAPPPRARPVHRPRAQPVPHPRARACTHAPTCPCPCPVLACGLGAPKTGLPIIILSVVNDALMSPAVRELRASKPSLPPTDPLVYLAVYQLTYPMLQWAVGDALLSGAIPVPFLGRRRAAASEASLLQRKPTVGLGAESDDADALARAADANGALTPVSAQPGPPTDVLQPSAKLAAPARATLARASTAANAYALLEAPPGTSNGGGGASGTGPPPHSPPRLPPAAQRLARAFSEPWDVFSARLAAEPVPEPELLPGERRTVALHLNAVADGEAGSRVAPRMRSREVECVDPRTGEHSRRLERFYVEGLPPPPPPRRASSILFGGDELVTDDLSGRSAAEMGVGRVGSQHGAALAPPTPRAQPSLPEEESAADESAEPSEFADARSEPDPQPSHGRVATARRALWSAQEMLLLAIDRILVPPVRATLLGLCLAVIPFTRAALVPGPSSPAPPLGWLLSGISKLGDAAVPVNLLTLGASLSKGPDFRAISPRACLAIAFAKLLAMPAIALVIAGTTNFFVSSIPHPFQQVFLLVIFVVAATPTANNVLCARRACARDAMGARRAPARRRSRGGARPRARTPADALARCARMRPRHAAAGSCARSTGRTERR